VWARSAEGSWVVYEWWRRRRRRGGLGKNGAGAGAGSCRLGRMLEAVEVNKKGTRSIAARRRAATYRFRGI
jgi:hypothetical protein